jgi:hypothetical protein
LLGSIFGIANIEVFRTLNISLHFNISRKNREKSKKSYFCAVFICTFAAHLRENALRVKAAAQQKRTSSICARLALHLHR